MDFVNVVVLLSIVQSRFAIGQALEQNGMNGRPPRIYDQPSKEVYIIRGEPLVLPCAASGEPEPEYRWKLNGRRVNVALRNDMVHTNSSRGDLTLTDPDITDEGNYQCFAVNRVGVSVSVKAHVREARLGIFHDEPPKTHVVMEGDSLVLLCYPPISFPPAKIFWSYENGVVNLNNRITTSPEGPLLFTNVQKSDEKGGRRYACNALNGLKRVVTQGFYHYIQVRDVPSPHLIPPAVMYKSPTDNLAVVGEKNYQLKCVFSGNPTPEVVWQYPSSSDHISILNFGTTLQINTVSRDSGGNFTCRGQQRAQSQITAVEYFFIRVEEAPYWITELEDRSAVEGGSVVFTCDAGGIREPDILWYINGIPIEGVPRSRKFARLTKQTLAFFDLTLEDQLNVQCNATNRHGYIFGEATLTVDPATDMTSP